MHIMWNLFYGGYDRLETIDILSEEEKVGVALSDQPIKTGMTSFCNYKQILTRTQKDKFIDLFTNLINEVKSGYSNISDVDIEEWNKQFKEKG